METLITIFWIIILLLFVIVLVSQKKKEQHFKKISDALDEIEKNLDKSIDKPKTRNMFECPYDYERRSCKHMNTATGYLDVECKDCDWFDSGVRPFKS